ncbi:MAG: CBS domain-containing protein [Clostridia bacterium]
MNKVSIFTESYRRLEQLVSIKFGLDDHESAIAYLAQRKGFQRYAEGLHHIRRVRNLLFHDNPKYEGEFIVEPSDKLIEFIAYIGDILTHPISCHDIAVKKVHTASLNDGVLYAMRDMREKGYRHLPIVENRRVIGMFTDGTIFAYMLKDGIMEISESTTFADLKEFLRFDSHLHETFVFMKKDAPVDEAEEAFGNIFGDFKRIGMILLTENGKPSEPLLGILTPWNVIGAGDKMA